jgi:beta-lactam-binding protein with PASTA domain
MDKPQAGYYGGLSAAPVFQAIASRWLAINGNLGFENIVAKHDTVFVPNVKGFFSADAMAILSGYGFKPRLENLNDGVVISQSPECGSKIPKGTEILLTAQRFKTLISDTLDKKINDEEYRPNVIGFPLRTAIDVLQRAGVYVKVEGKGKVRSQSWVKNNTNWQCTLICSP